MARNPSTPRRIGRDVARRAFSFSIFGDVISELRRVTWPSRQETTRLTIMVIAVSVTIGAFLYIFDLGFAQLFDFILSDQF